MSAAAGRRLLHASSALVLLLAVFGSIEVLRVTLIGGVVIAVVLEVVRLNSPDVGAAIGRFVPVFRASEAHRLSGATWLAIGYALAAWLPHPAVTAGILAGAFADPTASWVGSTFGPKALRKTWVGSGAAAFVTALILLAIGVPLVTVGFGALTAMSLERWPGPFNDNLLVPPGVALVVWLIA